MARHRRSWPLTATDQCRAWPDSLPTMSLVFTSTAGGQLARGSKAGKLDCAGAVHGLKKPRSRRRQIKVNRNRENQFLFHLIALFG